MNHSVAVMAALVAVVLAAGFGLYAHSVPATRAITVQAYDFFFTVSGQEGQNPEIAVRTGDTIVLTLDNRGTVNDHEFFVLTTSDYANYANALASGKNAAEPKPAFPDSSVEDVPAGQSKTGTFVAGAPGTYVYACLDKMGTDPLTHANKGMYGTLTVGGGGVFGAIQSVQQAATAAIGRVPMIVVWQGAVLLTLVAAVRKE